MSLYCFTIYIEHVLSKFRSYYSSCPYSFSKHVLDTYYGPNIILSPGDISESKTDKRPCFHGAGILEGETGSR